MAHLIFQVPQGGILEVGHSLFSFTQKGLAHGNSNRGVQEKHSDTGNWEDKEGTIKGQENEEAGDRDDPNVLDRWKHMIWDRTAETHHRIQTLLHLPGHQIFAKHHCCHKLLGILHGILTGRETGARRSKQCFIPNSVAGKPGAQTPIQAAPGFGDLLLVEEEPDLHIPWPNHSPAHDSGYSRERKCLNSMPQSFSNSLGMEGQPRKISHAPEATM